MESIFKLFMVSNATYGIAKIIIVVLFLPIFVFLFFMVFHSFISFFSKNEKEKLDHAKSHNKWEDMGEKYFSFFLDRIPWKFSFLLLIIFIIWYIN